MPVQTAAGGSGAGFRQSPYGLLPPVGAPLPARHGALKAGDLLPLRPAGIFDRLFDRLAVLVGDGERQERLDAPVIGASICAALPNDLQALQGERQIPRSAAVQQFAGLDRAALSRLTARLDDADALEAEFAVLPVRARNEAPAVAVRLETEAGIAAQRFEPGETRRPRALLRPVEEGLERLVETAKRDLLRRAVDRCELRPFPAQSSRPWSA
jgi:hypothetical protein